MKYLLLAFLLIQNIFANELFEQLKKYPIDQESKSPYDFRGTTKIKFEPYQKLYKTKTYWELHQALRNCLGKWEAPHKKGAKPEIIDAYITVKQAYIRTCCIYGELSNADRILESFHPKNRATPEQLEKELRAEIENEHIQQFGKQVQRLVITLENKDPFPKGPPKTYREILPVLLNIVNSMVGEEPIKIPK